MGKSFADRVPFAKIITVLAVAFGVGLGLCCLNGTLAAAGVARKSIGAFADPILSIIGILSLAVMILSAIGLIITTILWVIAAVVGSFSPKESEPQRLFEEKDNEDFKD
jgi:hypothetical protein